MQHAMEQFSRITLPSGPAITLAMKAAVAIVPVRRFVVGDPTVQPLDALAGATLDLGWLAAEHQARKGEVVLSAETADRLQPQDCHRRVAHGCGRRALCRAATLDFAGYATSVA